MWFSKVVDSIFRYKLTSDITFPDFLYRYAILVGSYSEFENTTEKIKLGYEYKVGI